MKANVDLKNSRELGDKFGQHLQTSLAVLPRNVAMASAFVVLAMAGVGMSVLFAYFTFGASGREFFFNLIVLMTSLCFILVLWRVLLEPLLHSLHSPSSHGNQMTQQHVYNSALNGNQGLGMGMRRLYAQEARPPHSFENRDDHTPRAVDKDNGAPNTASSSNASSSVNTLTLTGSDDRERERERDFHQQQAHDSDNIITSGEPMLLRSNNLMRQYVSAFSYGFSSYRYPTAADKEPVSLVFTMIVRPAVSPSHGRRNARARDRARHSEWQQQAQQQQAQQAQMQLCYGATVMITSTEEDLHSRCLTVWEGAHAAYWYPPASLGNPDERQMWTIRSLQSAVAAPAHAQDKKEDGLSGSASAATTTNITATTMSASATTTAETKSTHQSKDLDTPALPLKYGDMFVLENVHFASKYTARPPSSRYCYLNLYLSGGTYYLTTSHEKCLWMLEREGTVLPRAD